MNRGRRLLSRRHDRPAICWRCWLRLQRFSIARGLHISSSLRLCETLSSNSTSLLGPLSSPLPGLSHRNSHGLSQGSSDEVLTVSGIAPSLYGAIAAQDEYAETSSAKGTTKWWKKWWEKKRRRRRSKAEYSNLDKDAGRKAYLESITEHMHATGSGQWSHVYHNALVSHIAQNRAPRIMKQFSGKPLLSPFQAMHRTRFWYYDSPEPKQSKTITDLLRLNVLAQEARQGDQISEDQVHADLTSEYASGSSGCGYSTRPQGNAIASHIDIDYNSVFGQQVENTKAGQRGERACGNPQSAPFSTIIPSPHTLPRRTMGSYGSAPVGEKYNARFRRQLHVSSQVSDFNKTSLSLISPAIFCLSAMSSALSVAGTGAHKPCCGNDRRSHCRAQYPCHRQMYTNVWSKGFAAGGAINVARQSSNSP